MSIPIAGKSRLTAVSYHPQRLSLKSRRTLVPMQAQSIDFKVRGELQMTQEDSASPWAYSLYLRKNHRSLPLIVRIAAAEGLWTFSHAKAICIGLEPPLFLRRVEFCPIMPQVVAFGRRFCVSLLPSRFLLVSLMSCGACGA